MVNWGKNPPANDSVRRAVQEKGASRVLDVGPVNHQTTEKQVSDLVASISPTTEIESVRLAPERGVAVVTMISISDAMGAQHLLHGKKMGDNPLWHLKAEFARAPPKQQGGGGGGPVPPPPPPGGAPHGGPPPPPPPGGPGGPPMGAPPPPPPGGPPGGLIITGSF